MGIDIPPFDYIVTDGRKLNDYDYNVETVDFWLWGKFFTLINSLKGGQITEDEFKELLSKFLAVLFN
jgi:hypothetical protein